MNSLTVIQAAQGLAAHVKKTFDAASLKRGVVIGYDGRYQSEHFAHLMASVMHHEGIYTYVFGRVVPTPFVAFGVRYLRCLAGAMITASHNAKEYNGCKVFWERGTQIVSPQDKHIAQSIAEHLEPKKTSWQPFKGDADPLDEVTDAYFRNFLHHYRPHHLDPVAPRAANTSRPDPGKQRYVITYTAMHGVGTPFMLRALKELRVAVEDVVLVKAQAQPDPAFPTVRFPNPEEGARSMRLALETARACGASLILANDPDADRLSVGEEDPHSQDYRLFNGNEMGALLGWWALECVKLRQRTETAAAGDLSNYVFLHSAVSSSLLGSLAAKEGATCIETLTGFKWMGSIAERLEREDATKKVLFAYEESIGYMWGNHVYDKDGITAAAIVADMALYLMRHHQRRLADQLELLYQHVGYHLTSGSYVTATDVVKVPAVITSLQTRDAGGYPRRVAGVAVAHVRDLAAGVDTRQADGKATLPTSKSSPIVTLYFANQVRFTLRGSGTEPKLKWYAEMITSDRSARGAFEHFVRTVVEELVEPEKHGFKRRPEDIEAAQKSKC
ncbi:phosphoglucomutase [Strigomonas culicis]|uniref:Phosphoglucomutase n=1 Tax=Strigomonas culicis TaxID=28005 RepID=S9VYB1_9TRYP|nr:phosphoglucomutase [Strigomonas culicis]|eukprot:EPY32086.1 phosphoglucomutase [Strigomonas culicis]